MDFLNSALVSEAVTVLAVASKMTLLSVPALDPSSGSGNPVSLGLDCAMINEFLRSKYSAALGTQFLVSPMHMLKISRFVDPTELKA
jgi:hypothetical protein